MTDSNPYPSITQQTKVQQRAILGPVMMDSWLSDSDSSRASMTVVSVGSGIPSGPAHPSRSSRIYSSTWGASLEEAQVEQVGYLRSFAEGLTDCPCAWRQPDKNKAGKPCPIVGNFQAVNSPQNQPILWIELTLWVLLFFSVQKGIPKNPRAEFSRPWILASSLPSCNPISSWVGLS